MRPFALQRGLFFRSVTLCDVRRLHRSAGVRDGRGKRGAGERNVVHGRQPSVRHPAGDTTRPSPRRRRPVRRLRRAELVRRDALRDAETRLRILLVVVPELTLPLYFV